MLIHLLKKYKYNLNEILKEIFIFNLIQKFYDKDTVIYDLGCSNSFRYEYFKNKTKIIGVEAFNYNISKNKYNEYLITDILLFRKREKFPENKKIFILNDVIEHFSKEDGIEIINLLSTLKDSLIILFTPNGFISQSEIDNNPFQKHKSGWYCQEFKKNGFDILGSLGPKFLRKEEGELKYKPKFIWGIISLLLFFPMALFPKQSFSLLAWKKT